MGSFLNIGDLRYRLRHTKVYDTWGRSFLLGQGFCKAHEVNVGPGGGASGFHEDVGEGPDIPACHVLIYSRGSGS